MDRELQALKEAVNRILMQDPELAEEIRDTRPKVVSELPGVGGPEVMGERLDALTLKGELETIVRKKGRPVLTVRKDDFTFSATDVESEVWRSRLKDAHDVLRAAIPSVGRVELQNNPDSPGSAPPGADRRNHAVATAMSPRCSASKGRLHLRTEPGLAGALASSIDFGGKKARHHDSS